jgi:hypothetical protein
MTQNAGERKKKKGIRVSGKRLWTNYVNGVGYEF